MSIRDNLAWGCDNDDDEENDVTLEQIIEAATMANVHKYYSLSLFLSSLSSFSQGACEGPVSYIFGIPVYLYFLKNLLEQDWNGNNRWSSFSSISMIMVDFCGPNLKIPIIFTKRNL
jgi:hypothetical protein